MIFKNKKINYIYPLKEILNQNYFSNESKIQLNNTIENE